MTPGQILTLISSAVSIILGFGAVALAVYFYTQAKNSEARVSNTLESIKAQTDTLQRLTARQMDRLIRGYTDSRPPDESYLYMIVETIKQIPTSIASQLQGASSTTTSQALLVEVVTCYITAYYYAGIANLTLQGLLPPLADLKPNDTIKQLVDQSYADFFTLDGILGRLEASWLTSNRLHHLYTEADLWKSIPLVKDSTTVYQEREAAQTAS